MTTTDPTIPGLLGIDAEGFPFWEPEELDAARDAFLNDVKGALGFNVMSAFEDVLHALTFKGDQRYDGSRFREPFLALLARLADREARRAELVPPTARPAEATVADRLAELEAQADRITESLRLLLDYLVERDGPFAGREDLWQAVDAKDERDKVGVFAEGWDG